MSRDKVLIALTVLGSGLCWWPLIREPILEFSPWIVVGVVALIVARRMARNDRLAAERLAAMKAAIESSQPRAEGAKEGCDPIALSHRYSGPTFSRSDWLRVLGDNAVKEDGYVFWMKCEKNGRYKIAAVPDRIKGDGTRSFCTDDSGKSSVGPVSNEEQWRAAMNQQGLPSCP